MKLHFESSILIFFCDRLLLKGCFPYGKRDPFELNFLALSASPGKYNEQEYYIAATILMFFITTNKMQL